jgi:hypothetical protein
MIHEHSGDLATARERPGMGRSVYVVQLLERAMDGGGLEAEAAVGKWLANGAAKSNWARLKGACANADEPVSQARNIASSSLSCRPAGG